MESGKNRQVHSRTLEEGNSVVYNQHHLINGIKWINQNNNNI